MATDTSVYGPLLGETPRKFGAGEERIGQMYASRCLSDTGFFARNLCGWNYDTHRKTRQHIHPGGVRKDGAHKAICDALDDRHSRYKLILAPRESYKSSILQAFVGRHILRNPDVRVLYLMRSEEQAKRKALAVRAMLELPIVTQLFGEQKGPQWNEQSLIVATRQQTNLQEPTFMVGSLDTIPTGGHYDLIILDDLVDDKNYVSSTGMEKARQIIQRIQPLGTGGTITVVVGTRYHPHDIYADAMNNPLFSSPTGITLTYGTGVRVFYNSLTQSLDLEVEEEGLVFPHLDREFLRERLLGMSSGKDYYNFSCQYLNVVPHSVNSPFRREKFHPIRWQDWMRDCTGYLLTDTATSLKKEGCHSVLAYMLLDDQDNCYLCSLQIGHWRPPEFIKRFFDLLDRWSARVNHAGEVWERISMVQVYQDALRLDERSRKIKLSPILLERGSQDRKHQRILALEPVFERDSFHVVDTIEREYAELDGPRRLFDPEHYRDRTSPMRLPDGELVRQFIEYKPDDKAAKKDIPDCIAMLFEKQKDKVRACRYRTYRTNVRQDRELGLPNKRAASMVPGPTDSTDWWSRAINGLDA